MVLKLYTYERSTCGQRVAMTLIEKGVPFEFHNIDLMKGEHKAPAFMEKQPFGQVPYIDDDGFILYESRAIARYIDAKFPGTKLSPSTDDIKAYGLFEQALSNEVSNFNPAISAAVFEKLFKPMFGGQTDDATLKQHLDTAEAKLAVFDQILSKQKYMAGEEFTLADIFHIPYGALLAAIGSDLMTSKPNVARWWKEVTSRPSWTAVAGGIKGTA